MASKVVFALVLVWCSCMYECLPYTQVDVLLLTRCGAACRTKTDKQKCETECLLSTEHKPGHCPQNIAGKFDGACIEACSRDTECPEIDKCCSHSCGKTCQAPVGLESVEGLSNIPENITIERDKSRSAIVKWQMKPGPSPFKYIIEERHHAGKNWVPSYLGNWIVRNKTNKTRCIVKNLVPGHWYQFRVASVNGKGTRGFSQPSTQHFTLNSRPKIPKMPYNLTVSKLGWLNGTLYGVLNWEVPESDLPIQMYKVFWSSRPDNTTFRIHHASVSNRKTSYILKKLEPNSIYFLQVQALSQFGKERLKSEKGAIILKTKLQKPANYNWTNHFNTQGKNYKNSGNHGLRHTRFFWLNEKLHCHLEWSSQSGSFRYLLTWMPSSSSSCGSSSKHETQEATTEDSSFDVYGLKFDCKYKIVLEDTNRKNLKLGTIYITTPSCKEYLGHPGIHSC